MSTMKALDLMRQGRKQLEEGNGESPRPCAKQAPQAAPSATSARTVMAAGVAQSSEHTKHTGTVRTDSCHFPLSSDRGW